MIDAGSMSGTHKGEFYGVAPTGKKVTMEGVTIHQIEDGKILDSTINWDTLGLMRQLGAVPAMKQTAAGGSHGT